MNYILYFVCVYIVVVQLFLIKWSVTYHVVHYVIFLLSLNPSWEERLCTNFSVCVYVGCLGVWIIDVEHKCFYESLNHFFISSEFAQLFIVYWLSLSNVPIMHFLVLFLPVASLGKDKILSILCIMYVVFICPYIDTVCIDSWGAQKDTSWSWFWCNQHSHWIWFSRIHYAGKGGLLGYHI